MRRCAAALILLLVSASPGLAQQCATATGAGNLNATCVVSPAVTLTLTKPKVVRMTVSPPVAALLPPLTSDYNRGYQQALGHVITVRANTGWQLQVHSEQAQFTAAGGARTTKPRSDLLWAPNPADASFQPMTGTPTNLFSSPNATAGTNVPLYYRVLWDWAADRPGTYSMVVVLTLSTP